MKFLFFFALLVGLLFEGCLNTEGVLELSGRVIDEETKATIPGREIIIQALVMTDTIIAVNAGHTSTDSSGSFKYSLTKIKDARYYNFYLVGDSEYFYKTTELGLSELEKNALFLTFSLSKLTEFSIKKRRITKIPECDTLCLSWASNGFFGNSISSINIDNIGIKPAIGLCWIGGNVVSTIQTRVFAGKKTEVFWELNRNGKRSYLIDTITCRRDSKNNVYFSY
jgi:hypothetical protein